MSTTGILDFQGTNKATFVGENSNVVIDTVNASFGIGVDVNGPTSNLHVVGNAYVTSNLEVGTANLFVDTSTSNVGIGTNAPGYTLDVVGDAAISSNLAVGTNKLFVDTVNSRVGVGTTDPLETLDVRGTIIAPVVGYLANQDAPYLIAGTSGYTGAATNWNTHGFQHRIKSNSGGTPRITVDTSQVGEAFTIVNNGNVGIGTTDPGTKLHVNGDLRIGSSPNDTVDDNNSREISTAGQLTIKSNDSGLNNSFVNLVLQSGNTNPGKIVIGGGTTDQYRDIEFYTSGSSTERMRIHHNGNVGIGTTSPGYKLEVNGKMGQNGKEIYTQLRWEIDLTSQSNTTFYPIEFTHPSLEGTSDLPDMHPIHFKIFGESLGGNDPYNENTLVGYAKGGGWSDHGPMYDVHVERHHADETRFQGLYEGNQGYMNGIVIYVRGGYRYSALTDATEVVTHTSAYTNGSTTFALKNSSGTDVSGTSALITQLVNIAGANGEQRWMSGKLSVSGNVGIGTDTPLGRLHVQTETRSGTEGSGNGIYVTSDCSEYSNGSEFRHSNQTQGTGIGYAGIYATGSNANQDLHIVSRGTGTTEIKNYQVFSDDRVKMNEEYITNATETLLKLKPQIYDKHEEIGVLSDNPLREAGLIAQDIYYDTPELRYLVSTRNKGIDAEPVNIPQEKPFVDDDPANDPDYSGWGTAPASVAYIQLVPYLIKSNQEIYTELQAEKARNDSLELRILALENA